MTRNNQKIDNQLEIQIDRLSFTGKGIGRIDNFVIFVPNTIPGDFVRVEITNAKRRYADARVIEYLRRSEQSIEPRCGHFNICGGCSFQNLPYDLQLEAKQEAVLEHLKRIGKIENPPMEPIIPCEEQFFYRNKMEYSFKPDDRDFLKLGLHHRGEWEQIFDITECLLQSPLSNAIVTRARDFFRQKQIPAYHLSEHHGFLRFLVIRESRALGEIMLILVTSAGEFTVQDEFIGMLNNEFPQITSIVRIINSKKANIAQGESEEIIRGKEYITEKIGGKDFKIRPSSFFQTNSRQVNLLYEKALEYGRFDRDESVLDLYTGCGTIAIYIADKVKDVLGIELNEEAIRGALENASLNKTDNCEFRAGDVRRELDEILKSERYFDSVIIDPPRAGIGRKVISRILRLRPKKIVYVSCNPSTLASDLHEFIKGGYNLERVVPVDMFPHTFHIENVSRLSLAE